MTEFWKSNARKFCEFCRVWFADNKSSINFHERGKKHQEAVQRKLDELRRKGRKQHEEQQHTKGYLQQMEEDALKAFKKDAQEDCSLVGQYNDAAVEFKVRQFQEQAENEPNPSKEEQGTWYEGKNEDGHSYYWNNVSGVSQWEKPEKFVPHEEPKEETKEEESGDEETGGDKGEEDEENDAAKEDKKETDPKDENVEAPPPKGRKRKSDAYGGWTTVVREDSPQIDLELPASNQTFISQYQPQVEQRQPKEEIEFGTKTVTSLAPPSSSSTNTSVGFKKRKTKKGGARSLRQREDT